MARLELDGVSKRFGDSIVAVDDLSVAVEDGEFLVLVGPSGSGKSTALRMVAGLESVTEGEIRLGEETLDDKPPKDRDIAMVFQSYALYPHMTVRGNMSFGLEESTDLPDEEIRERVEETAEILDITELLDRNPKELSGGQQQRVALGRAIVRDPEVFLMDEPLSNLDAKLRAQTRTELQQLQEDLGVTTVYVTHDQTEAMTMGDKIAVLDHGQLQQLGTPLECYHDPANRFVAGFLGEPSMNFFDVRLEDARLVGEDFEYPVSEEILDDLGGTTELVLGIRPESIEFVDEADGPHDFETVVDVVEPMGDENVVYLSFAGQATDGHHLVATTAGLRQVSRGERMVARIPEEAVHLFDRETGRSLHNRAIESEDVADVRAE